MKFIKIFQPVDTLIKFLAHTLLSWSLGFISGVLVNWLFNVFVDAAKQVSSTNYFGLDWIAPLVIVLIAVFTIWQNVQDVIELIEQIKSFGFRLF